MGSGSALQFRENAHIKPTSSQHTIGHAIFATCNFIFFAVDECKNDLKIVGQNVPVQFTLLQLAVWFSALLLTQDAF